MEAVLWLCQSCASCSFHVSSVLVNARLWIWEREGAMCTAGKGEGYWPKWKKDVLSVSHRCEISPEKFCNDVFMPYNSVAIHRHSV